MRQTREFGVQLVFFSLALIASIIITHYIKFDFIVRVLPFADVRLFFFFRYALVVSIYSIIYSIYVSIQKKGFYIAHTVMYTGFILYVIFLFYVLFYGRENVSNKGTMNITLFHTIYSYFRAYQIGNADFLYLFTNIIGNIFLFIPVGALFVYFTKGRKGFLFLFFLSILFFFGIEFLQLKLKVGSFDVDDILLNVIGCMVGVMITKRIRKINR